MEMVCSQNSQNALYFSGKTATRMKPVRLLSSRVRSMWMENRLMTSLSSMRRMRSETAGAVRPTWSPMCFRVVRLSVCSRFRI
jgi:hypothetical protein